MIVESRGAFYNDRIEAASADPRRRRAATRNVLHLTESHQVRSSDDSARLSTGFSQCFVENIRSIKAALKERRGATYNDPFEFDVRHDAAMLADVQPPTVDEVLRAIRSMPAKSSPLDSIPTSVIKTCAETFAVLVSRLITLSFAEGKFPDKYKFASVTPLQNKKVWTATHSATTDRSPIFTPSPRLWSECLCRRWSTT
jgi:hypothetical protein